jgi:hypothetical protein
MSGDRTNRALARIEAALERIEAAARRRPEPVNAAELAELQARHGRLRAAVTDSLAELDQLIAGAEA